MVMDPRNLSISDYDYSLPNERIAHFPLSERDASRLLVCAGSFLQDTFKNIGNHLPEDSLLIFNNTRVIEARLLFKKPTGASIEVFCLEPGDQYLDITTAFAQKNNVFWKCLVGNAASWPPKMTLELKTGNYSLFARQVEKKSDHFIVQLSWTPENLSFAEILNVTGAVPLPPYIKRRPDASDAERYQTVYAETAGSVAAPTAGLHFTPAVLNNLSQKNISQHFVTLHVGAGTFKPVKADTVGSHDMHAEYFEVNISVIQNLLHFLHKSITAVGTTSLRTLESLYWLGVKIKLNAEIAADDLFVDQWEPYDSTVNISAAESLEALKGWMLKNNLQVLTAKTAILIAPPYQFKIVNILITNFHQPRSTLLLLVAAFFGERWKSAYAYALDNDFRFLSYGDSCLFIRQ